MRISNARWQFLLDLREQVLRRINLRALAEVKKHLAASSRLPVFVIASPPDMHLASLAVWAVPPEIQPVIMANGLSSEDVSWLQRQVASGIPVVQLKASLSSNHQTFLSHAEVVRLSSHTAKGDFVIQDADCFVLDPGWWRSLRIDDRSRYYACGPFGKPFNLLDGRMPDTFLVLLNGGAYHRREKSGIQPDIRTFASVALSAKLRAADLPVDYYPDDVKTYYDTLQEHWTAAAIDGQEFKELPGADEVVMHVGGSSYLTRPPAHDVSYWDYCQLNTPYFHLRVLEHERFAFIRPRFAALYEHFLSADALLEAYPGFIESNRFRTSQRVLAYFRPLLQVAR